MKISIIGAAGCVGSSIAFNIVQQKLTDELVVADIRKDWLEHHAIDFFDAAVASGIDFDIAMGSYEDLANSDIVIMAAGASAREGDLNSGRALPSRQQMLPGNLGILAEWAPAINQFCPQAIIIMVSNPAEVLNYAAYLHSSTRERRRFIGYSLNDTIRFKIALADALSVAPSRVEATVVGEHGGSMVLLFSSVRVDGKPVSIEEDVRAQIRDKTNDYLPHMIRLNLPRTSGWLTGTGVARLVKAIIGNTGEVIPCGAVLDGEYGYRETSIGVPVSLGREGIREIIDYPLTADEKDLLEKSIANVQKSVDYVVENVKR